jgi:hypothetical protein
MGEAPRINLGLMRFQGLITRATGLPPAGYRRT